MSDYIQVVISSANENEIEILIALLNEINYEGFEEDAEKLTAYISSKKFDEAELKLVLQEFNKSYRLNIIAQKNWNSEWEENFQPVKVGKFAGIRAGFHEPLKNVAHEIVITPKMSFGTGHHATTHMMIQQMQHIDFRKKTVLDFGTGTGILAILAEKLGADKILAVDNDDWSIDNANENIGINQCSHIILKKGSSAQNEEGYNIILANIIKTVILENLEFFNNALNANGSLVMSGLLENDLPEILSITEKLKLELIKQLENRGWFCLYFIKK